MDDVVKFDGVRVTHPDRVLFPDMGLTKRDLIAYYEAVRESMMPHVLDRPVSLVRCPQGRHRNCFFQRHAGESAPGALPVTPIREQSGSTADYLYIEGPESLIAGVQIGTLEFHIWGARRATIETPDRLVFDLDPDPSVDFAAVRAAAVEVRDFLDGLGLETFPLLTGGKGIHVVAPLVPDREWPVIKRFARAVAERLAERAPERYIATASKARRRGRIFIDYLRNERGASAVAPYSTRARSGAPVAAPVSWAELSRIERANAYSVEAMLRRIKRLKRDPWAGYDGVRQSLGDAVMARLDAV
ncbi:MAG TPA: non-homologous end-joining DNA ligase [Alphaproteobacteria bacterium]|jgi:bifunctional non-homologous end joining protein LigD|nr:non-homologous end-joining DNA ligase [Alphaproteobacteria bacterium]